MAARTADKPEEESFVPQGGLARVTDTVLWFAVAVGLHVCLFFKYV